MLASPPSPVSGGHHMVLQYTVEMVTHLMMARGKRTINQVMQKKPSGFLT